MNSEWEIAARRGDVETLRVLADAGADIDALDRYGQTALMLTSIYGHGDAVRFLIERGAALDNTAKYGLSAVMLAVVNGHVEIVQMLVQAGADTTLRGCGAPGFAGKTAADLAAARGDSELTAVLCAAEEG